MQSEARSLYEINEHRGQNATQSSTKRRSFERDRMKVIVVHREARHRYAIPLFLNQHQCLEAFYTDLCFPGYFGKLISHRRSCQALPLAFLKNSPYLFLKTKWLSRCEPSRSFEIREKLFSEKLFQWGIRDASMIYATYQEGLPFLHYAKSKGLKIVVEVNAEPNLFHIRQAEQSCFPDWEDPLPEDFIKLVDQKTKETIELADALFCPSEAVKTGLINLAGYDLPKAKIVSYGCLPIKKTKNQAVYGRVLFVGIACLGKGIHYYARAAALLSKKYPYIPWDFRVAGLVSERVRLHPETKKLNFLGKLSHERVFREMSQADVFVLPTLSESVPTVLFEALALGLPIVITPCAHAPVEHGREGLIVPERRSDFLAENIYEIVRDRRLRKFMAQEAALTSMQYMPAKWSQWLVQALGEVFRDTP